LLHGLIVGALVVGIEEGALLGDEEGICVGFELG